MQRRAFSVGFVGAVTLHVVLIVLIIFVVRGRPVKPVPKQPPVVLDLSAITAPQLMQQPKPLATPKPKPPPQLAPNPPKRVRPMRHPQTTPPPKVKPPPTLAPSPHKLPIPVESNTHEKAASSAPPKSPKKEKAKKNVPPKSKSKPSSAISGAISHKVSDKFHEELEKAIREHLRYPPIARRQGREGTATVRVRMARDGTLLSVKLVKGSGTKSLDHEAQEVFYRIGKLPKMPPDFMPHAKVFDFQLAVNFHLLGFD